MMSRRSGAPVVLVPLALLCAGLVAERVQTFSLFKFAVRRSPELMPSSRAVPAEEIASGRPVLSLVAADDDLYDPATGILANPRQRGKDWERPATVSFFEGGELRFATGAGVRVHGGGSRAQQVKQGLRLYFRPRHGARQIDSRLVFDRDVGPLRELVVHNDVRRDRARRPWHFNNPLAYDIARRIGNVTVETKPARLFLNGEFQGVYVLTERIEREFLESRFPGNRMAGLGVGADIVDRALELTSWLDAQPSLTVDAVSRRVDLENLTRWFLAVLFCATEDVFQAPGQFFDPSRPTGGWFWVVWDLDQSFMDLKVVTREPWLRDTFYTVLDSEPNRGSNRGEPRAAILSRLWKEDPRYREYFKEQFSLTMNHRLTPAFLAERYAHYGRIATTYDVGNTNYLSILKEFLDRRPAALRKLAEARLATGASHELHVTADAGVRLSIGSEPIEPEYRGYYFPGTTLTVRAQPLRGRAISHWLVNGAAVVEDGDLTLNLDADTRVEVVTAPSASARHSR
jgi:hypothetical protein